MSWDFFKSRGFWAAILATITALSVCVVGDGDCGEAILAAVAGWLGFLGVSATRPKGARSHAEVMRLLEQQRDLIRQLRK